ncbi:MAG: type II toxin-antitoxin system Phd/YefM family antitoxin [Proteobacteria bacterium]|nr:type II toxin-antitoxin system Phd/YefM family antitoxin [Pseudomonadota bacterium]MBI3495913.1 type II toxin-antitoxin system Phd/YefM family antitoxin [Pseudomonadota bacterium]
MNKTLKASEFKAKCLKVMDEVAASGEPVTITKKGKPVARLVPFQERPKTAFGALKGMVTIKGDIISPLDAGWEALEE